MGLKLDRARMKAALAVCRVSIADLAKQTDLSLPHVYNVLRGCFNCTPKMALVLKDALGPAAWAFVVGESNVLSDEVATHASA